MEHNKDNAELYSMCGLQGAAMNMADSAAFRQQAHPLSLAGTQASGCWTSACWCCWRLAGALRHRMLSRTFHSPPAPMAAQDPQRHQLCRRERQAMLRPICEAQVSVAPCGSAPFCTCGTQQSHAPLSAVAEDVDKA